MDRQELLDWAGAGFSRRNEESPELVAAYRSLAEAWDEAELDFGPVGYYLIPRKDVRKLDAGMAHIDALREGDT